MTPDLLSFLMFVVITTFTPGPNNISSAVMGLNYGYRKTLKYLMGIASGFFVVMEICAFLASYLLDTIPRMERYLAVIGALYIVWLAWHTLRATYGFENGETAPLSYINGFLLQLLNPKVIIYGMTIYSTFLKSLPRTSLLLPASAAGLAFAGLAAISTWTLFGTFIRRFMKNEGIRKGLNITLAILLLFTAVRISGLLELVEISGGRVSG